MNDPIMIVGAGLSGLHAASLLTSRGIPCQVLESRDRLGGRILSETVKGRADLGTFDLGPTWFWPQHEPLISRLVRELGLGTFDQHAQGAVLLERGQHQPAERHSLPKESMQQSVRLAGGVAPLIEAVAATLPPGTVELSTTVKEIVKNEDGTLLLKTERADGKVKHRQGKAVILALPPRMIVSAITFRPDLPEKVIKSLQDKPTWMAGQAKALAIYETPFWREQGLSGQVMSWAGPLQEIHDASPDTGGAALFGFFGRSAAERQELGPTRLRQEVVAQLNRLFGPGAKEPIAFLYKDWSRDSHTAVDADAVPLTAFPIYGPPTLPDVWNKKIAFAGTETSVQHGGHLEGALHAAVRAVSEVTAS
ncbi:flavin monoamine oxidase family protein [Salisediminibacterium beveridgei]|uniref:Monoamine oxidase n=1 Tax=Salisediminibacterium beveridgei TaxID=632773 RepID=A0A1D7QYL9_9BACI|nr:FAD-dependent oxidoreductase [Salisediminibacterium beveridgei]AOM84097.1 monoamine oxidase [Salisediminibacterium beveridgei]